MARRHLVGLVSAAMVLMALLLMARWAVGTPGPPVPSPPVVEIGADWADNTIQTTWDGRQYQTIEASFIGDRIASPGDSAARTLNIQNNGPSAANMTVSLVVDETPPGTPGTGLAQDISLFWNVGGVKGQARFADLLVSPQTAVATVPIAQGAKVPVTVGFTFSRSGTSGISDPSTLSFSVMINLEETTAVPLPPPVTEPPTVPPPVTEPPTEPPTVPETPPVTEPPTVPETPTVPVPPVPEPPAGQTGGHVGHPLIPAVALLAGGAALALLELRRRRAKNWAEG